MAEYRLRGPVDGCEQSLRVDNGCSSRQPAGARGSLDDAVAGHASEWDPLTLARRADAVIAAYRIGRVRAPAAIRCATGLDDLPRLADGVIGGLLQIASAVAATTALGAAVGAAVGAALGALAGGVGAAPGAAAGLASGAAFGFDAGMAMLTWLGLGALAFEVARGLGEVTALVQRAVVSAWEAEGKPARESEIDAAGQCFADAIGKLMLLVMIAIVARLMVRPALASGEAAAGSASEFLATLRRSRLGGEFAEWVEANSERLVRNPKLRSHSETRGQSAGGTQGQTPSGLKHEMSRGGGAGVADEPMTKPVTPPVTEFKLDPALVRRIQAMQKGQRPDPSTYMPADVVESQLSQFDGGATRFMLKSNLDKYGVAQKDGSAFIMTKAQADALVESAGGSARAMEEALGLPEGTLESGQLVRVDVPAPRDLGLRIPSGNEPGANELWIPGGKLPNGNLEAVADLGKAPPSRISVRELKFGGAE